MSSDDTELTPEKITPTNGSSKTIVVGVRFSPVEVDMIDAVQRRLGHRDRGSVIRPVIQRYVREILGS